MRRIPIVLSGVVLCFSLSACHRTSAEQSASAPIVGTWFVKAPEAPFQYHMFVFHSDGTMQQMNSDAGDPNTSDSNGMGVWVLDGDRIRDKFVEVTADRTTHQFASRGEISFLISVTGNIFSGSATAVFYDAQGGRLKGPLPATLQGERILP